MAVVDFASIEKILLNAHRQGRLGLYEHECYDLLSSTGAEAAFSSLSTSRPASLRIRANSASRLVAQPHRTVSAIAARTAEKPTARRLESIPVTFFSTLPPF